MAVLCQLLCFAVLLNNRWDQSEGCDLSRFIDAATVLKHLEILILLKTKSFALNIKYI